MGKYWESLMYKGHEACACTLESIDECDEGKADVYTDYHFGCYCTNTDSAPYNGGCLGDYICCTRGTAQLTNVGICVDPCLNGHFCPKNTKELAGTSGNEIWNIVGGTYDEWCKATPRVAAIPWSSAATLAQLEGKEAVSNPSAGLTQEQIEQRKEQGDQNYNDMHEF